MQLNKKIRGYFPDFLWENLTDLEIDLYIFEND